MGYPWKRILTYILPCFQKCFQSISTEQKVITLLFTYYMYVRTKFCSLESTFGVTEEYPQTLAMLMRKFCYTIFSTVYLP